MNVETIAKVDQLHVTERKRDKSKMLQYVGLSYKVNGRTITDIGKIVGGCGIIKLCIGYVKSVIPTRYSSSDFKKKSCYMNWNLEK